MKNLLFLAVFFSSSLNAGTSEKVERILSKVGMVSKVESAGAYEAQRAGHATGGGVYVRNAVKSARPVNIQLPDYAAGCGGIDLYGGGVSLISASEMESTLRSLVSSAGVYAFMLGMETTMPNIANTMRQLQSWSNDLNAININSCEAGRNLVFGLSPTNATVSEHVCQQVSHDTGKSSSWIKNQHKCREMAEAKKIIESNKNENHSLKGMLDLQGDFNLAWKAMEQAGITDKETKILLMNVLGTFIHSSGEDIVIPPLIQSDAKIFDLLHGSAIESFCRCKKDDDGCVSTYFVTREKKDSWFQETNQKLFSIANKIIDNTTLDESEISLIEGQKTPVLELLRSMVELHGEKITPILAQAADFISRDIFLSFVEESIGQIRIGITQLKTKNIGGEALDGYASDIQQLSQKIQHLQEKVAHDRQRFLEEQIAFFNLKKWKEKNVI